MLQGKHLNGYLYISLYDCSFFHVIPTCIQNSPPRTLQTIHFFYYWQEFDYKVSIKPYFKEESYENTLMYYQKFEYILYHVVIIA